MLRKNRTLRRPRSCSPSRRRVGGLGRRVFSLLEAMFGKDQTDCLSDLIQGALMLRYNQRAVG